VFLVPTILQLLDAFPPINLSEQCWIQLTPRKFLGKVGTSVLQRQGNLILERLTTYDPIQLMLLEEAQPIVKPDVFLRCLAEALQQRQLRQSDLLEPSHIEGPDMIVGAAEDFAQFFQGHKGNMIRVVDELPVA